MVGKIQIVTDNIYIVLNSAFDQPSKKKNKKNLNHDPSYL